MVTEAQILKKVRKTLIRLFSKPFDVRIILQDAEVPQSRINFEQAIEYIWVEALDEAKKHDRISAVIAEAWEIYKADPDLVELAEVFIGKRAFVQKNGASEELISKPLVHRPSFSELESLLHDLEEKLPTEYNHIEPVGGEKLNANHLDCFAREQLRHGMIFAADIARYFAETHRGEEFADRIAAKYRTLYQSLREHKLPPREIYRRLYSFTAERGSESPQAVAAVLAYLFERCDIFENTPDIAYPAGAATCGTVS